jgi:hypothetical protein
VLVACCWLVVDYKYNMQMHYQFILCESEETEYSVSITKQPATRNQQLQLEDQKSIVS